MFDGVHAQCEMGCFKGPAESMHNMAVATEIDLNARAAEPRDTWTRAYKVVHVRSLP